MTIPQENQANDTQDTKQKDKDYNFRAVMKQLEAVKAEKDRLAAELERVKTISNDDDDDYDDEPYVAPKKLEKKLAKFSQQTKKETQNDIQQAVHTALEKEREKAWLEQNKDFHDIMQPAMLQKFMDAKPDLVQNILSMPDTFERQKLVYANIKALGLDKPVSKEPSIQDKVNANRQNPYYQPSGVGTAPYASAGDFSPSGQKQAYEKMQELKNRLRI
jgi:hypothetical protein